MDVTALAGLAGNALVSAAVSDAWQELRHKVARLFGRGKADPKIDQRLDATRADLVSAPRSERAGVQERLAAQWETRFADFLADYPDAEGELTVLVREMRAAAPVAAADHAVAAGGDVTIRAEGGSIAVGVIHGDVGLGPSRPGAVTQ